MPRHNEGKNIFNDNNEVLIAVIAAVFGTLLIILFALVFYLLRTRSSSCTKPTATDEEKQSVLTKRTIVTEPGSIVATKTVPECRRQTEADDLFPPTSQHLELPSQQVHARFQHPSGGGGRQSPFNYPGSNSSIRSTPRGSIKDRRLSNAGSVSSLTLSITSSASQASQPGGKKSTKAQQNRSIVRSKDYQMLLHKSKPLSVDSLQGIVHSLGQLSTEFMSLPMNHPESLDVRYDKHKNRHPSILPNSHSRIRLSGTRYRNDVDGYINANFIQGYQNSPGYIAAQGPVPSTVEDFWWMIWQEKVSVVVMLTKLRERNKLMCEKYWPLKNATYGDIMVTCEYNLNPDSRYQLNGYLIAEIESANQRRVEQYCYLDWPDREVPDDASGLFSIMEEIAKHRQFESASGGSAFPTAPPGPVLVHCSAGIGRTGCYIALDAAIDKFDRDQTIDILGTVAKIRLDRGGMVQTLEQYEFIHKALLQYIKRQQKLRTPAATRSQSPFFSENETEP